MPQLKVNKFKIFKTKPKSIYQSKEFNPEYFYEKQVGGDPICYRITVLLLFKNHCKSF